ncbi:MAG: LacI family DNA-binding transcriptional regulator [Cyclobacteriaceae bacterium]
MKKNLTIHDIAAKFNVSPSTVSRALKDHKSIGKKTREAIKSYADEQGYQVNSLAASLRSQKTNTIGVIVSWIDRPFISSLISGVETVANNMGYSVIISQTRDNYAREVANADVLFKARVEGLIVSLAMESVNYDHFDKFINSKIPTVFVDRVPESTLADKVIIDNFRSSFQATEHLIELGCRRIAHIAGSQSRLIYRERKEGYLAALQKHGLASDEELIQYSQSVSRENAYELSDQLLSMDNRPDSFFCANDLSAVSVIQCARNRHIPVPDELKVIGFNNDPVSTIIDPSLSTISLPSTRMGEIAVEHIINKQENKTAETVILDTELIVRGSTVKNPVVRQVV